MTHDQACAERYWRTHDKRYLYEVEIDEDAILHRADMHMVDAIGKRAKEGHPQHAGLCDVRRTCEEILAQ